MARSPQNKQKTLTPPGAGEPLRREELADAKSRRMEKGRGGSGRERLASVLASIWLQVRGAESDPGTCAARSENKATS